MELTFWDYCYVDKARLVLAEEVGGTLRLVHDTFDQLGGRLPYLPSFELQLSEAEELLSNSAAVPQLSENDRLFLWNVSRETIESRSAVCALGPVRAEAGQGLLERSRRAFAAAIEPVLELADADGMRGLGLFDTDCQAGQILLKTRSLFTWNRWGLLPVS